MNIDSLKDLFSEIDGLLSNVDSPAEPYKSKYRARDVIVAAQSTLLSSEDAAADAPLTGAGSSLDSLYRLDLDAILEVIKSKISTDTEECSPAILTMAAPLAYLLLRLGLLRDFLDTGAHRVFGRATHNGTVSFDFHATPQMKAFASRFAKVYLALFGPPDGDGAKGSALKQKLAEVVGNAMPVEPVPPETYKADLAAGVANVSLPPDGDDEPSPAQAAPGAEADTPAADAAALEASLCSLAPPMCSEAQRLQLIPFAVMALNCAGAMWGNLGQLDVALAALQFAERVAAAFAFSSDLLATGDEHGGLLRYDAALSARIAAKALEGTGINPYLPLPSGPAMTDMVTYTYYFLAQVHGENTDPVNAALYCGKTLVRQYTYRSSAGPFDARDFISNALNLQKYFVSKGLYRPAYTLLRCAADVYDEHIAASGVPADAPADARADEADQELKVRMSVERARAFSAVLAQARQNMVDAVLKHEEEARYIAGLSGARPEEVEGSALALASAPGSGLGEPMVRNLAELEALLTGDFVEVMGEPPSPFRILVSPECAQELYAAAQDLFTTAQNFFVIDGFVTDHCQIALDISSLYDTFATYEGTVARRISLHVKRAALMEGLAASISRVHYQQLVSAMLRDGCEARGAIFELRYAALPQGLRAAVENFEAAALIAAKKRALDSEGASLLGRAAASCANAIDAWKKFSSALYADASLRCAREHGMHKRDYSDEEVLGYLTGLERESLEEGIFETGKLLSRMPVLDLRERTAALSDALKAFARVRFLWERNEAMQRKDESLRLIDSMTALLGEKVRQITTLLAKL